MTYVPKPLRLDTNWVQCSIGQRINLLNQGSVLNLLSVLTAIFTNSDDFWIYDKLKQYGTRMEVLQVQDLSKEQALGALRLYRARCHKEEPTQDLLEQVYDRIGGRLTYLSRVARTPDMLQACEKICHTEKTWFLNKCWILGEEMDDDVMDEQKYSVRLPTPHVSFSLHQTSRQTLTLAVLLTYHSPQLWS